MAIPVVMTENGAIPTPPSTLNAELIALAVASNPGLTTNLPGTLIEDIASTDTGALVLIDQARVETINSLTPYGANLFILNQLGNVYGVTPGVPANTSVYVVFSSVTAGYVIPKGVIVSDGTYQYTTQEASVIEGGGSSSSVYCVATVSGSWAVPANTIVNIVSSVPSGVSLTVTNPTTGIPSTSEQTPEDYRNQVLGAGLIAASGMVQAIKTYLQNVPGVVHSLISIRQNEYYSPSKWEVIVGGGDPTAVANAIWSSCGDPNTLCGSTMLVQSITKANPGKVTTNLVHGFTTGSTVYITDIVGMTELNGDALVITTVPGDPYSFTINQNTTSYNTYISGGIVSTSNSSIVNPRNNLVTIYNTPDTYEIPFVTPIQQPTAVQITWNTSSTGVVSNTNVQSACVIPVSDYINNLGPGQAINIYELQYIFQEAVQSILATALITNIQIQITLNGVVVSPVVGTGVVVGDPEGYYYVSASGVTTVRG